MKIRISEDDLFQCKMDANCRRFYMSDYTSPREMLRAMVRRHVLKKDTERSGEEGRFYRPRKDIEVKNLDEDLARMFYNGCLIRWDGEKFSEVFEG